MFAQLIEAGSIDGEICVCMPAGWYPSDPPTHCYTGVCPAFFGDCQTGKCK
jgi:hypothetical protein